MDVLTTTSLGEIPGIVERARAEFDSGRTRSREWRESTLLRLRELLIERENDIVEACAADMGKPPTEAWVTEVGFPVTQIDHTLAHLSKWMRPTRVGTPVGFLPGSSKVIREPLGTVLVIAPWNYPVQLLVLPVAAAIAAGNSVVAKPSEVVPTVDGVIAEVIAAIGDPAVAVVQGGVAETTEVLGQRFDHIFYTGNGRVGRIVMEAAAQHLTPVTLELGGKSPAIVSRKADLEVAARRIAWGKFLNAGQTCVAPDYVLVERPVHDELVSQIEVAITDFYGDDPQSSPDLARVVNDAHFHRLEKLLDSGTVALGGESDPDTRYIAPTVLTEVEIDSEVMAEEIFGPILPVLPVDSIDEASRIVNTRDKPLALYVFSEDSAEVDAVLDGTSSGGVGVNSTILHLSNPNLPFGGVGPSGMGAYHGEAGFDTFSHRRSVYRRSTRVDPPLLYPPYTDKKADVIRRGLTLPDPRDVMAKAWGRVRR